VTVLTRHFLAKHMADKTTASITDEALHALSQYAWPGNVRELENVLERAMIVNGKTVITPVHLPVEMMMFSEQNVALSDSSSAQASGNEGALSISNTPQTNAMDMPNAVSALEKRMIIEALAQTSGNKSRAAKVLQISERSLWYKLELYGLK